MTRALLITADPGLHDELQRLAAAAGATCESARDPAAALRGWAGAALVLVGADLVTDLAVIAPARRRGVHVVAWGSVPDQVFRPAVAVGAESVVELPRHGDRVTELLTDLGEERAVRGLAVGVIGGCGGAGATTFAAALAQVASRQGTSVLVDVDPLGPGGDRTLGLEERPGVRWNDLAHTTGRLSARELRQALPRAGTLAVLTWSPGEPRQVPPAAAREALSAARRGHDLVALDLPRRPDEVSEELAPRCDLVLVVVTDTLTGLSAARRVVAGLPDPARARLVVRGPCADPDAVARAVGLPVLLTMADQRGLSESIELGLGPVRGRRGPLARAAGEVLGRLGARPAAAA